MGIGAVVASVVAVVVTLHAGFLRYPGWLAAQKADFIIGPTLTGLYWLRRRPQSPFGFLLIGWGFVGALYVLQSVDHSWPFTVGLVWEKVFGLVTYVVILAFPTGRLDRPARILVGGGVVIVLALALAIQFLQPQVGAGGSISSCRSLCPYNKLVITSDPSLAQDLFRVFSFIVFALALATAALLVHRFITGTPPQRRALAIGLPVALLFLACEMTFQLLNILGAEGTRFYGVEIWVFVAARAAVWYGFLFALIAAQLFASRALQHLVRQSLRRPSKQELETLLREPLGDPRLELRFWDAETDSWNLPIEPKPGLIATIVDLEGQPSAALIHDAQLADDPELLQTAGSVALLAAENAQLDGDWKRALDELKASRIRMGQAIDRERQRLAMNLHDGPQQRLGAARLRIGAVSELTRGTPVNDRLEIIGSSLDETIGELREISHELYPHTLFERGLVGAIEGAIAPLLVRHNEIGRHIPEVDTAVYYCVLESVRNATKHGSSSVTIDVVVEETPTAIRFAVTDDGDGFDPAAPSDGIGLKSLNDRLETVAGELAVASAPGCTTVSGAIPLPPRTARAAN